MSSISRRGVVAAAGLAVPAVSQAAQTAARRVAVLGDSITTGYGLPQSQALPAALQSELARLGAPARVLGAGVDGSTTAGGAARVDRAAPKGTAVCVVALGGNDLLTGAEPRAVARNLDLIVRRLKARGVTVVLAGVRVPSLIGGDYARAFNGAFAEVARTHDVIFLPDLLEGVALNPRLNQRDGIHPNAAGVAVIARRLAPLVARALRAG
ncbi:arylesterase [Phenylobacterium sp.]|jgi:acyl-CoA thioesterase-1|uniref:arylesterase n=1 Tax=Phenylobacterium sp. TaxID=1871053 RepID=UPI0037852489